MRPGYLASLTTAADLPIAALNTHYPLDSCPRAAGWRLRAVARSEMRTKRVSAVNRTFVIHSAASSNYCSAQRDARP